MAPIDLSSVGERNRRARRLSGMRRSLLGLVTITLVASACAAGERQVAGPQPPSPSIAPTSAAPATTVTPTTPPPTATVTPSAHPTCTTAGVVRRWSLPRRAAQVLAVPARDFDTAGAATEVAAGAGGVLFLGSTPPPHDLRLRLRSLVGHAGRVRPLVMADEEGGGVQRLQGLVAAIPWARTMAQTMSVAQVQALARSTGRQMRALGVTSDLAPVLDVDARPGPSSANADGERSFSGHASVAAAYGTAFMAGLRAGGVLPVVKHFPGLGGARRNTDVGPGSTRPLATLRVRDLLPFRAAIRAGAPAVMTSNASVPGLTSLPASLSHAVINGLLRRELGFHGLVITDSLSAGAIRAVTPSLGDATVRALAAGADLVLFGSTLTPADDVALQASRTLATYRTVVAAVVAAVHSGRLAVTRLDNAVGHVLAAKHVDLCR
jgi:beta-N-acetylhexosaminidase